MQQIIEWSGVLAFSVFLVCICIITWILTKSYLDADKVSEVEYKITPQPEKPPIIPPSPDQLALAFAAALLTNPKMAESPEAAIAKAWWLVPEWYRGRVEYEHTIAPMFFGDNTPDSGNDIEDAAACIAGMSPEERRLRGYEA